MWYIPEHAEHNLATGGGGGRREGEVACDRQAYWQSGGYIGMQTGSQAGRRVGRYADRQPDRQKDRET